MFLTDRKRKFGGVTIYIKSVFDVQLLLSESVSKELQLLALEVEVTKDHHIMMVRCYRPLSAPSCSLSTLITFLSTIQ